MASSSAHCQHAASCPQRCCRAWPEALGWLCCSREDAKGNLGVYLSQGVRAVAVQGLKRMSHYHADSQQRM